MFWDSAFASSRKIQTGMPWAYPSRMVEIVMAQSTYPKDGNPLWETQSRSHNKSAVAHTLKWYTNYTAFD